MSGPHRHYTYYWRRCRECGRPAVDCSEYCEECADQLTAEDEVQQIADQIALDEREAAEADAVPEAFPCTCTMPFVPSNALEPPEPILDRYCPQHGDGGPDPDRLYEERRDALMEDARDRRPHDNED